MNTNEKGLSFSNILDELISTKSLKDLHLLPLKDLDLKVPELINKKMSSPAATQLHTLLKNVNILVEKAPKFLIDEISTTHPNLLSALASSDIPAPTIIPSQTEEEYTVSDILENQISMFPPIIDRENLILNCSKKISSLYHKEQFSNSTTRFKVLIEALEKSKISFEIFNQNTIK